MKRLATICLLYVYWIFIFFDKSTMCVRALIGIWAEIIGIRIVIEIRTVIAAECVCGTTIITTSLSGQKKNLTSSKCINVQPVISLVPGKVESVVYI